MDLRLIETFVQAARRGGFSAAARALGISPAAVSQNVRSLEDQLGARLFERTTRQVRLTAEGARFLDRCAPAVEALAEAAAFLQDEREAIRGTLRVTSTTAVGRQHVMPLLPSFLALHPELTLDLQLWDGFTDLVAEGFDVAIRGGILPENQYIARLLLPVTPLVCAAPAYFAAHGRPERIADLHRHRLIGMRSNPSQRVFAWEFRQEDALVVRVDVEPSFVVNDPEAATLAAVHGLGLAQLGSNLVLPHVATDRLELALTAHAVRTRGLYAVWPSRRHTARKVTAFVQHLAEHFATRGDLVFDDSGSPA
jgi:DNA-binding transcriptional LysR family regulator